MSFSVGAHAYDQFMGRYSRVLAPRFAEFAGVRTGRALDVGCGPGALALELARTLGADSVCAVDPSETFVAALRERNDAVAVQRSEAEDLPFANDEFDATLAQLLVHFMRDPVIGLQEMVRVTRPGGTVAACVWDHAGGRGPLSPFWDAARSLDAGVHDESRLAGARAGHLTELFRAAGLRDVEEHIITVEIAHTSFEDWWKPFLLGVGPAGKYVQQLNASQQKALREACRERVSGDLPTISAGAWAARSRAA